MYQGCVVLSEDGRNHLVVKSGITNLTARHVNTEELLIRTLVRLIRQGRGGPTSSPFSLHLGGLLFGRIWILQIRILKSDPDPGYYWHLQNQFKHLNFFHIKHISSDI